MLSLAHMVVEDELISSINSIVIPGEDFDRVFKAMYSSV